MSHGGSDDVTRALRQAANALFQVAARLGDLAGTLDSAGPSTETARRTSSGTVDRVIDLTDDAPGDGTVDGRARVVAEELVGW